MSNEKDIYLSCRQMFCPVGIAQPTDAEVIIQMRKKMLELCDFNAEKCRENAELVDTIEKLGSESLSLGDVINIKCGDINQQFKLTKIVINYDSTASPTIQIDGIGYELEPK